MQITDQRTGKEHSLVFDAEVIAALNGVEEQFACAHPDTEVRETRASNGSAHYRNQCLVCGARVGNAVKTPVGSVASEDIAPRAGWETRYRSAKSSAFQRMLERQLARDSDCWKKYKAYLSSPAWAARRALVLKRASYICEGCGTASATQVHHLTYTNVGHEFLFDLVAVCGDCHERLHADDPEDQDESAIGEVLDF